MAVYAFCTVCQNMRDHCSDVPGHKSALKWRADVMLPKENRRLRKLFLKKENADIQERQWRTDHERGQLLPNEKHVAMTFEELADEWATMVKRQNQIKDYKRSEKSRVEMFKELFGKQVISQLSFQDGEDWMNDRLDDGKAIATVNRDLKTLKWIMDYAVTKEYIQVNPFAKLKELKGANIRCRWMSEAEVQQLINVTEKLGDFELADVIVVGVNTGFRKGNLERLNARDISANRLTASKTKSGKPYDVPRCPAIEPTLQRLLSTHPTGPLLNTIKLDARFREAVRQAGLYKEKGDPENVTIHTLRHTFAALYLKRGGDIYKLSKLLGHASIGITEKVYAHLCESVMDAQAQMMSTFIQTSRLSETQTNLKVI